MSGQEIDVYVEDHSEEDFIRLIQAVRRRFGQNEKRLSEFDHEFDRLLEQHIEEHLDTWRALAGY